MESMSATSCGFEATLSGRGPSAPEVRAVITPDVAAVRIKWRLESGVGAFVFIR
jgi:hypothetical protein